MGVSTIPAVLDELVVRAGLAVEGMTLPDKPPVQVLDGGPHKNTSPEVIAIGFTGISGEAAVENTVTVEQMTADPNREQYDVTCLASSWLGNQVDPKVVRDRVYALTDAIADEIARDQTLGGLLMRARVSSQLFAQQQTDKGAVATVRYIVHCDGYTR
jgi:hypothetical protein